MRELSQETAPSLFDAPPPMSYLHAKDFVRWCCSFGPDFRNSPDVTNLRYWMLKTSTQVEKRDEAEILDTARSLFFERLEKRAREVN